MDEPQIQRRPAMHYRAEIDGLRALAVLPVILHHAGLPGLPGGFVGVDIFFVISGYLITSIIAAELQAGTFTYRHFYERRIRRILPALALVLAVSCPLAWALMLPADLAEFAGSILAVQVFASNFFFAQQADYFATSSQMKPLLHTWSLAIEEQFYLVFPPLLVLAMRVSLLRPTIITMLAVLAAASLSLCLAWAASRPDLAFYSPATRAWELLAGAICALAAAPRSGETRNILAAAGLALITIALLTFDAGAGYPSWRAVLPVAGTCLVLRYGLSGTLAARLLSWSPFVAIGLISYSAYLWHQPLLAFARHACLCELSTGTSLALVILTLVLAALTWRFVEEPFRSRTTFGRRVNIAPPAAAVAALATITAIVGAGHITGGWQGRAASAPGAAAFLASFDNSWPHRPYYRGLHDAYGIDCSFHDLDREATLRRSVTEPRPAIGTACTTRDPAKPKTVLLWGDSHAQMLRPGLASHLPNDWQLLQVATENCPPAFETPTEAPAFCAASNHAAVATLRAAQPDIVVLAQYWVADPAALLALTHRIRDSGAKEVVVVGPAPRWRTGVPAVLVRNHWPTPPRRTKTGLEPFVRIGDAQLRAQLEAEIRYVSLTDALCDPSGCMVTSGDNLPADVTTWDGHHLTKSASALVARTALVPAILGGDTVATRRRSSQPQNF